MSTNEDRLTRRQAAIIGLFTGICCGPFSDMHELAEELLGMPIWTHEFALSETTQRLKEAVRPLFLALCASEEDS